MDTFLIRYDPNLIRQPDPDNYRQVYLDLGYGFEPTTTLESTTRFHKLNPHLFTIGVEIDPERVTSATPNNTDQIEFRLGGFNLPIRANERVRLLRAFNVLRQYDPSQVHDAYKVLASYMIDGGLIIEGTSDPFGRVWTANLVRKLDDESLNYEAITFSTNFRYGFDPGIFQPVLPKNLIHQMNTDSQIDHFINDWKTSTRAKVGYKQYGFRHWFIESANQLANKGYHLDPRKKMLKSGYLSWKDPDLEIKEHS